MKKISSYIAVILTLMLLTAGAAFAATDAPVMPEAETDSYLITISEIIDQHELSASEKDGADPVMIYELPVGSVITVTAKTEGISQEITRYNERNRKIDSFSMSKTGKPNGDAKELEAGTTVSYAVTKADTSYAFMSVDLAEKGKTTSFFFRVVEAPKSEASEESKVELIVTAVPTSSPTYVDGDKQDFLAYYINGYNYFKLRDIAAVLSGTAKQFEVDWDADKNSISLTTGKPYTLQSGDLTTSSSKENKTGLATQSHIFLDGEEIAFVAYTIGGNNYFKLRDLGKALNFAVGWDPVVKDITIDSEDEYTE